MTNLELGYKSFLWYPPPLLSRHQIRNTKMVLGRVVFMRPLISRHSLMERHVMDLVLLLCCRCECMLVAADSTLQLTHGR